MNPTTLYLSQLMGPVCLLLGVSLLLHKKQYVEMIKNIKKSQLSLMLDAIVETTAGTALLLSHHLWGSTPEILVTLLGYGLILDGLFIFLGGKALLKDMIKAMAKGIDQLTLLTGGLMILWGGYFSYVGYFM